MPATLILQTNNPGTHMTSIVGALAAIVASQIPVVANINYGSSACNSAKTAGYLPFTVDFTCSMHPGQDGCVASDLFDLDVWNGAQFPRFCQRTSGPLPELRQVKVVISGVLADASGGPVNHNVFSTSADVNGFNPSTFEVDWKTQFLWRNMPNTMVDKVKVSIFGMFIFTSDKEVALFDLQSSCSALSDTCSVTTALSLPSNYILGGVSLNSFRVEAPQEPYGVEPTSLEVELNETTAGGSHQITSKCVVGSAAAVQCNLNGVAITGKPGRVEPFRWAQAWMGPVNVTQSFSPPTGGIAGMNCGLRRFRVEPDGPAVGRQFQSLWLGQHSTDCGWSPGDVYTGQFFFGWESPYGPDYLQENRADGTRLP